MVEKETFFKRFWKGALLSCEVIVFSPWQKHANMP